MRVANTKFLDKPYQISFKNHFSIFGWFRVQNLDLKNNNEAVFLKIKYQSERSVQVLITKDMHMKL